MVSYSAMTSKNTTILTDLLTGDKTVLNGALDALTALLLVTVVGSAVEKTVSGLNGVVYSL